MSVFVDSSALYAYIDRDDRAHLPAVNALRELRGREELVTHNYVVVEMTALLQRRFGPPAVQRLVDDGLSRMQVAWVTREVHDAALSALLADGGRDVSFVDQVSFELMRRNDIRRALCFDAHFARRGFETIPPIDPA